MGGTRLTRRRLLTGVGMAAVGAGLAACGDDGGGTAPGQTATTTSANGQGGSQPDEAALRKKIASLLVVGFRGESLNSGDWVMKAITEMGLGGVILFDKDQLTGDPRNIISPDQVKSLIQTLKQASSRLIVSVDQEGGKISRLNPANGFPAFKSQAEIGAANKPETTTRTWAREMAQTLASVGFNFNFAPVVDLNVNPTNPAVGELGRSFSADPNVVVANASEEIRQFREAKVTTANKHFPGLGSATANTDFSVVDVSDTWKPVELEPFKGLIANGMTDSVMVGHILNRQIDPQLPMSLSKAAINDMLRGQLGWKGAVVSDDMQAVAIVDRYSTEQAAELALTAGMDMLVYANQGVYDPDIVTKVVDSVVGLVGSGKLQESQIDAAVARVNTLRH